MKEGRSAFKVLIIKPAKKRLLGQFRPRRKVDIRLKYKEIGINTKNWVDSASDRDD